MTYLSIITNAAKVAHISVVLLYAICSHESRDFTLDFAEYDNGSPSFGVCQIKEATAKMLGFKGNAMELRNAVISTKYAALYLQYQLNRYNNNWCQAVAAYNAGSYLESEKKPGYPKNLRYVKLVQGKLRKDMQYRLECNKSNKYFIDNLKEE